MTWALFLVHFRPQGLRGSVGMTGHSSLDIFGNTHREWLVQLTTTINISFGNIWISFGIIWNHLVNIWTHLVNIWTMDFAQMMTLLIGPKTVRKLRCAGPRAAQRLFNVLPLFLLYCVLNKHHIVPLTCVHYSLPCLSYSDNGRYQTLPEVTQGSVVAQW